MLLLGTVALIVGAQTSLALGQTVAGVWQQIDEDTGKVNALITFAEAKGVFQGWISRLFPDPGDDPNPLCEKCPGSKQGKPLLGLIFIEGMKRSGLDYSDGTILDPESGNVYSANMTLSPDGTRLEVRGYLGISLFGRSQIWKRVQ
jgi:hypothetical protein